MANDAAKKNRKSWAKWVKIIGFVTSIITSLFAYFRIYKNYDTFSIWSWIGYIIIVITYFFTISQVLNSKLHGLPRPEMYWDGLITAWIVNLLMIFSSWTFWLSIWVPIVYIYKGINFARQLAGMGQAMGDNSEQGMQQTGKRKKRKKKKKRR
eukprot:258060_1